MKVGLVGFQSSGKTSVFNALTGQQAETGFGKKDANLGRIQVPDARVDALAKIYEPKKVTYAEIQFVDVAGPSSGSSGTGLDTKIVKDIREVDALVQVVRGFESALLSDPPNPAADVSGFTDELILTDLVQVETRLSRLRKQAKTKELEVMEKLAVELEAGHPVRDIELASDELSMIQGFSLLSQKPTLVVLNQGEAEVGEGVPDDVRKAAEERGVDIIGLCATIEAEIMSMEPDDQAAFLADLGLDEPVRSRFVRAAYGLLDLISFLTTGEDEVRAWTIRRGTPARQAAGKIHSDLERGFIRAEVTAYEDFIALGSEAKCKEAGKSRLEGKDYIVQDGDIMHIRHSS